MEEEVVLSAKSKKLDILLCVLLGVLGVHRLYEGKRITGILYLFTFGGFGLGVCLDLMQLIFGLRTDKKGLPIGVPGFKLRRMRVMSSMLGVLLWITGGFLSIHYITNLPMIRADYYTRVYAAAPLEKKYTQPGPFETSSDQYKSKETFFDTYKIWYPTAIKQSHTLYPIVVFANGSGIPFFKYEAIFNHLASWGFIVIGNDDSDSWSGQSSSDALHFLWSLNQDRNSPFYNRLDTQHIGIAGHSQGGVGVINAVTEFDNSNRFTSMYTASATELKLSNALKWNYDVTKIHIPYLMVAGTGEADANLIAPLTSLRENYNRVNEGALTIMARRKGANHGDMLADADGYMTAWFRYTLLQDPEAARVFTGSNPELVQNKTNWQDVQMKM
ncbi:NINE protein [Paenibacillus sp. WLX1005]|uniref:NINE protein n=1 Tax=Paenibacillus sp. WLX1005 TaxID=3243766 RepID=UPI0039842E4A